jgi:hypothetical protein
MIAQYVRLYADSVGESHFEDIQVELSAVDLAPPEPPLSLSSFLTAEQMGFLRAPAGWVADWHPSAANNMFVVISGEWEIEASDGSIRRFGPGEVLLVEDTTGRGHKSQVISNRDSLALLVQLTDRNS